MSTAVEINGVELVPIKDAALRFKYSRDYVSRLAREGKIVASQVGRQWFVDLASLESFSSTAAVVEEVRKEELRKERKRELMAKESLSALDEVMSQKTRAQRFDALVVTAAVVCLGIFTGVGFYTTSLLPSNKLASLSNSIVPQSGSEELLATAVLEESPFKKIDTPSDTLLLTTLVERPVFTDESEVVSMEGGLEGILLFAEKGEVRDAAAVANLFSDDVDVKFTGEHSGVISYDKGEGEMVDYPFVKIPSREDDSVDNESKVVNE